VLSRINEKNGLLLTKYWLMNSNMGLTRYGIGSFSIVNQCN